MYSKSDIEYIEKTVTWNWYVDLLTAKSWSLSNLTLFWWTTQDDTDVLQSVVLEWATVQRNVPEWYTELDYIRNVMNSTKFNTELTPQNWDVLELVWTAWSPTVSNYMFQSREWTQAWIYGISWSSSWWTIMWNRWSWQSLQSEILRTNWHKYYTKMSVIWTTLTLTVKDLTDKLENTKTREITETAWWPSKYFLRWNATQAQALWTAQSVYFARISNNGVDRIRLIPAKQWDTIWFYDMVSQTFMSTFVGDTPIASTAEATPSPFVPIDIVSNNGVLKYNTTTQTIYTEWQTETVQDSNWNTTTAEMLLKVSISNDYIDTQEVLTGAITRRIAIKVLDGTESWSVNSGDYNFFRLNSAVDFSGNLTTWFYCTHFVPASIASASNNQWIRLNSSSIFIRWDSLYAATSENLPLFKQWLAQQYANWTPIIIVYPLSTAVTETVSWQELIEAPVTQTAWSISNMTITVTSDWWTPTPSTPKDIICNNWVLKLSKNLLNLEDLEWSYLLTDSWQRWNSNDSRFLTNFIKVKPSTSYVFDFISWWDYVYRRICWYSSNDYNTFTELLIKKQRPTNEDERYSLQFTTWATTNYIKISSHRFDTNIQLIEWTEAIPYHNYGIYAEWTTETVKDSSNRTATAEMLLKIWNYADSQEVLSGAITRNIWVRAFDWTESRSRNDTRVSLDLWDNYFDNSTILYCTHYKWYTRGTSIANLPDMWCKFSSDLTWVLLIKDSVHNTSLADWKSYVASEYQNWTPIIIVYQLSTPTTETTTAQTLNVKSWTNKIEIVQASIDNLWISATYLSRE